jgi:hypothetical protein
MRNFIICTLQQILLVNKSMKMKILVGKSNRNTAFWRTRCKWEDKTELKEMGCEGENWIYLILLRMWRFC